MSASQEYIDRLFSDTLVFEQEVLHVNCDEDRKEVMTLVCRDMCEDASLASKISFLKIKSVDELDFSGIKIALMQLLLAELLSLMHEKGYSQEQMENVKKDKVYIKFLYELSQSYILRFGRHFYKEVVNTFFDLIAIADKPENLSPVVMEAISGTKKRKSLLEQHGGGQVLYKGEQAWMRVKQARDDKNNKVKRYQYEITKLVRRVDELRLHISAIVAANALSIEETKNVTPKLLLDMFTEEDDIQLHTKKTMFSYIPGGELAHTLVMIANQAAKQTRNPEEKDDYRQISEFFRKCQNLNTPSFLQNRLEEYKKELEMKNRRYREEHLKLKTLRERALDSFDITLKKVKDTMVYNLQHL